MILKFDTVLEDKMRLNDLRSKSTKILIGIKFVLRLEVCWGST
jgi:hypothetical protein